MKIHYLTNIGLENKQIKGGCKNPPIKRKDNMQSYPIWNKIQACIYKASKCYGVKNDGLNEILIGTSAKNSHSFVRTRVTHKKHDDGTRTYHFYIDDKLYKKINRGQG